VPKQKRATPPVALSARTKPLQSDHSVFLSDAATYLPSILVSSFVGIALLPITTRLFVPRSYGNYSIALAAINLLQGIATAWLGTTIIRFHPTAHGGVELRRMVSTSFTLALSASIALALALAFALFLVGHRLDDELYRLMLLVPVQIVAFNLLMLPLQLLRAERRIRLYNLLSIARSVLPPVVGLAITLLSGGNVVGMLVGATVTLWLLTPLGYAACFERQHRPKIQLYDKDWSKKLMLYGTPLIPTVLMIQVLDISDRFIVGAFRGSAEAGIYAAGFLVGSLPMELIIVFVTGAAAPLVTSIWEQKGRAAAEDLLTSVTRVFVLVALPALVGLSLMSKELMLLVSSRQYMGASVVVPFIAAGEFLLGLQWIAQRGLLLANRTRPVLAYYVIAGVSNVTLNVLLVPEYGYRAAGWSTLASYALLLVLIGWGSSPYLTWKLPKRSLIHSLVGCGVMAAALFWLPDGSGLPQLAVSSLKILLGASVYAGVLLMTREVGFARIRDTLKPRETQHEFS
jgi:O-antigen/teichoic acid export membrane protein